MPFAIQTFWLGATNTRPSRIKAKMQTKSVTVPWDHSVGSTENHIRAAQRLAAQCGAKLDPLPIDPPALNSGWLFVARYNGF